MKRVAQISLAILVLLVFTVGGGFVSGFFFDTVGPYLADNPDRRLVLGYAVGAIAALPILTMALLKVGWIAGWSLFGVYAFTALQALVLGLSAGNRRTTDAALDNLSTWRQDAGEFRGALLQVFVPLSIVGLTIVGRRIARYRGNRAPSDGPQP